MIYRFVIISAEVPGFRRDLRISGSDTFLRLHDALMADLGFDPKEPSVFRITDNRWNPTEDIYLYDMGMMDSDEELHLMKDTYLDSFLNTAKQRLLLTFDLIGNRSFNMELREITLGADLKEPEISRSEGLPPVQTTSPEEFLSSASAANTASEDYSFSEEEEGLSEGDLDGLDITTEEDQL